MKKLNRKKCHIYYLLIFIASGVLLSFCAFTAFASQDGVSSRVKKAKTKLDVSSHVEAAIPIPKDIVQAEMPYQGGRFYTESRKDKIKRFKCSSCHNDKPVNIRNAAKISHGEIKINHGDKDAALACNTCHSEKDRDYLTTSKGENIDIDHAYNMCGQCHFRQKKDWVGGAHGKRVSFWAGERVVKNCTSCHDPHSPRFEKRWPSTYSVPLN